MGDCRELKFGDPNKKKVEQIFDILILSGAIAGKIAYLGGK